MYKPLGRMWCSQDAVEHAVKYFIKVLLRYIVLEMNTLGRDLQWMVNFLHQCPSICYYQYFDIDNQVMSISVVSSSWRS